MRSRSIPDEERRRRVGWRHRLTPDRRTDDVREIADSVVALHSSDPATVYLSAMARMRNPTAETVEHALYDARSVVRHHGFRRTLWVLSRAMVAAMHHSTNRRLADSVTRQVSTFVEASGIPDAGEWIENGKAELLAELAQRGTATTRELGLAVPDVAVPLTVQGATIMAHTRLMTILGFDGSVVRTRPVGSWISSQYTWAVMDEWIDGGLTIAPDADPAGAVVDAYLRSFGPVTETDVRWWTGWTATQSRQALESVGAEAVQLDDGVGYVARNDDAPNGPVPWVAFLPGLDPTTMGWKERGWYLDPEHEAVLFDRNGNAGPTIWMDGRIVGGWVQAPDGEIRYRLLTAEATARSGEVDAAAQRLANSYGDIRHKVRFPVPLQSQLLG